MCKFRRRILVSAPRSVSLRDSRFVGRQRAGCMMATLNRNRPSLGLAASAPAPGLAPVRAALRLTPQGALRFETEADAPEMDGVVSATLAETFAQGGGHGLWRLGA